MYQARYRHADGTIKIWAANGPFLLISVDDHAAAKWAAAILVSGILSLIAGSRLKP